MATFTPFSGKGLVHYNHVGKEGYACSFCGKNFSSFPLYEVHWPKCTGVCNERVFKPFGSPEYPKFTSVFGQQAVAPQQQSASAKKPAASAAKKKK